MPNQYAVILRGMSPRRVWLGVCFGLLVQTPPATASTQPAAPTEPPDIQQSNAAPLPVNLSEASRLMLLNDHTYRAAISAHAASQTESAKGRAGLLPSVQFSYSYSRISGSRWQPGLRGQRIESDLSYNSSNRYAQLRQPILDYGRYANYQRGNALTSQGSATFLVQQQSAGLRLADAYFNVLLAYNERTLNESLTASLNAMYAALQARFRQSESTKIEVQETEARLSLARAELIATQDKLAVATRELQAIIGLTPAHVTLLRPDFPLPPLFPANLDEWLERGRTNNPEVRAAQEAVRVADAELDQAGSQYLPTLNLVATYGKTQSDSLSSLDQRTNTFTVGLQLDIPIFTGGYTTANVARARADRARLKYELSAAQERAQSTITRSYTDVQRGAERIRALQSAVESGQLGLDAARKGFTAGTQSNLDVLNTQDKLFQARFELIRAQLDYLQARVSLAAAVGELDTRLFDEINVTFLAPLSTTTPK